MSGWCTCGVADDAELEEGVCPTCGRPERAWFVGAVLAQLDDLDHAQSVEALEEALAWCLSPASPSPYDADTYDGSGLTVRDGARALARALALDERQAGALVAELRNALTPVHARSPSRGTARVLALADEISDSAGASAGRPRRG